MNKFIEWLKLKEYADTHPFNDEEIIFWKYSGSNDFTIATKQMLIGYMLEYLTTECGRCLGMASGMKNKSWETIDEYYDNLKLLIEEVNK